MPTQQNTVSLPLNCGLVAHVHAKRGAASGREKIYPQASSFKKCSI